MKRSFKHWTPLYVTSRINLILYTTFHPHKPWLTQKAIKILDELLKKDDTVLEFGAGRSTIYFAEKCRSVISIESNECWYRKISSQIIDKNLKNVEINLFNDKQYYNKILEYENESFDIILIDGIYRDKCAINSLDKIKKGGMLIIDNVNLYLPNSSKSPGSKRAYNSEDQSDIDWQNVEEKIRAWKKNWTTNNVTDTLILRKSINN